MRMPFEFVKRSFPKLEFIPDNSSKHLERPDYYQIFYGKNYIGIIRKNYKPQSGGSEGLEIVADLRDLTKLSDARCSNLIELLRNIKY
ncbi:MAG: hypothetical protein QXR60_04575 [Candidatus Nanoarchaeia archaeon]